MAIRSLQTLMDEADRLIASTRGDVVKVAAVAGLDDVVGVAQALINAGAIESGNDSGVVKTASESSGFDKLALALNRSLAAVEIESMEKIAKFCGSAQNNGYTDQQITEAVQKIAAASVKKNLATLVALEASATVGTGITQKVKKPVSTDQGCDVDLTNNMGRGL